MKKKPTQNNSNTSTLYIPTYTVVVLEVEKAITELNQKL